MHYYRLIFTAGSKPIFAAHLDTGGEISAVKIGYYRQSVTWAGGENGAITVGP
jgi:hypothetical protein